MAQSKLSFKESDVTFIESQGCFVKPGQIWKLPAI